MDNLAEIVAKAITNKRSYHSAPYAIEYDPETEQYDLMHYGTTILTFCLNRNKPLENGEYAMLGGGYSKSDGEAINLGLRHVKDVLGIEYSYQTEYAERYSKPNKQKRINEQYLTISKSRNGSCFLRKDKPKKQSTFNAFEPFPSMLQALKDKWTEERNILGKLLLKDLKIQIEYLATFQNANLTITDRGLEITFGKQRRILIDWNGDVYDLNTQEQVCVQVKDYDTKDLTETDICLTKALGIMQRPQVLNEGIHWSRFRTQWKTLSETVLENGKTQYDRDTEKKIVELSETRIYESFRKRVIHGFKWYIRTRWYTNQTYAKLKAEHERKQETEIVQLAFANNNTQMRFYAEETYRYTRQTQENKTIPARLIEVKLQ